MNDAAARRRGMLIAAAVALAVRLGVVAWAGGCFAPAGDGVFYHRIAERIAQGLGYTWVWPDGAVTFAAHYPVGYPALLAPFYAAFGASPTVAGIVNALLGAACAAATSRLLARSSPRAALAGGLVVAVHPALVAYTPAVMTEAATATLLSVAAALAQVAREVERPRAWILLAGLAMGCATLVRPQCLALAPALGWLAIGPVASAPWTRARAAAAATAVAVACCLPWTARNCARMDRCAFVSANGGWNLLIGTQGTSGGWEPVDVPGPCREVWGEADKDACFGRAARQRIASAPLEWLARAPAKLAVTFDYFGAAPWYLHASNPDAFDARAKVRLATVETIAHRALLLAAVAGVARLPGPRRRARLGVGIVAGVFALLPWAWVATVLLAACTLLLGARALARGALLLPWTAAVILVTAATHAVFFGAGRYGLVVVPFVAALALAARPEADGRDRSSEEAHSEPKLTREV